MEADYREKVLLKFDDNQVNTWTVDDAVKGTSILGATGSGKTSASGKMIAKAFLKEGWGGLVLCAKSDEANLWQKYCDKAGRGKDVILFEKGALVKGKDMVFNPIDYEMKRSGEGAGETTNLTNIFMNIYRMGNRISGEGEVKEERYWDSALKRCLNRVIELLKLAGQDLSYFNMVKVISTTTDLNKDALTRIIMKDEHGEPLNELEEDSNYCLKCLWDAYSLYKKHDTETPPDIEYALNMVEDYFTVAMPNMAEKTKSVVTESFMGLAEPFLSGILKKHFAGATNIFPEWIFEQQKIIILNFSVKEYLEAGITAQSLFKLLFEQAIERRDTEEFPIPSFLWADEAHYFVNSYDQIYLTTARSSRAATVFLSQNISNYLAIMGNGDASKAKVDSLMGNLCTKIFHANSDAPTNEYASRLIGQALMDMRSKSESFKHSSLSSNYTENSAPAFHPQIQPKEFTVLKTGGKMNGFEVHGILAVNGKTWNNGRNFLKVLFKQQFNKS